MRGFSLASFFIVLCLAASSATAGPIVISFSGGPGLGSGTIAPGQGYAYNLDSSHSWGAPGVGNGVEGFAGSTSLAVEDFTITFAGLGSGIVITNLAPVGDCTGGLAGTVFCARIGSSYEQWTPVISSDGLTVTFTAPGTETLANGNSFFVNVFFSGAEQDSASFVGGWSTAAPEPGTIFAGASGLLMLGLLRRRRMGRA